jgi:hypothetical protein
LQNRTQEKHCKVTKKTELVSVPATPKKKKQNKKEHAVPVTFIMKWQ